jgi:hypothetical protein
MGPLQEFHSGGPHAFPLQKKNRGKKLMNEDFFFTLFGSDFMSSVLMHEYCPNFLIIQIKTCSKRRNEK